jgi:hypothetical protein
MEEKIMSKTSDSSTLEHDALADSKLDAVSGGSFDLGNVVSSVIKATTVEPAGPPEVWVGCAWVPQRS